MPKIICGRKLITIQKQGTILAEDIPKMTTGVSSLGWLIAGIEVFHTDEYYVSTDEFCSDIDGAMQLFKLRTGLNGRIYICS